MFKQLLISTFLLSTFCIGLSQGTELSFTIKKATQKAQEPAIVTYAIHDYQRETGEETTDSFRLYLQPKTKTFEYRIAKPRFWKGGGFPDLQHTILNYYKADSLLYIVTYDSITGEQTFVIGGTNLNQRTNKTRNWFYPATGNQYMYNNYSVCTDTAAMLQIGDTSIPCYKTESYYTTPQHLGMYRERRYTTIYIAKQSLLPVKMEEEAEVLQIHMAIHFSPAERKAFKQKKIRSAIAVNYPAAQ